jgi:type I restriction enzyme S subunit
MTIEAGGTAIKHIYITRLAKMPVALPPIPEQVAISDSISFHRRRLDMLVRTVHSVIRRLRELRTALISAAVTGKIDVREEAA